MVVCQMNSFLFNDIIQTIPKLINTGNIVIHERYSMYNKIYIILHVYCCSVMSFILFEVCNSKYYIKFNHGITQMQIITSRLGEK